MTQKTYSAQEVRDAALEEAAKCLEKRWESRAYGHHGMAYEDASDMIRSLKTKLTNALQPNTAVIPLHDPDYPDRLPDRIYVRYRHGGITNEFSLGAVRLDKPRAAITAALAKITKGNGGG